MYLQVLYDEFWVPAIGRVQIHLTNTGKTTRGPRKSSVRPRLGKQTEQI